MSLDDAYANSAHIPDGDGYYARWDEAAAAFRATQGRRDVDAWGEIYAPKSATRGIVVIVHGGYWMAGSPSMFSHLAAGSLKAGFVCALPSYNLAPQARIADMTRQIAERIGEIARAFDGPIYLVGHSAGAHLVARMVCADITAPWQDRIARVMAISPLGDLAPLMETAMNDTLRLDAAEAQSESPIHYARHDIPVTVWVGGAERPVFLHQAARLANAWGCDHVIEPDRHHFDVIEGLETADSAMTQALFS